ncbi:MAG: aminotransferase class I/II-fold pyridoxal phosphate-dependent enzyme [Pseudomonadota bacterium]
MYRLTKEITERLVPFIDSLASTPVDASHSISADALKDLREEIPRTGSELSSVLDVLFEEAVPPSLSPISGGFMGYVPGGGIFMAALADLISNTINRYVGAYPVAPALSEIEADVIRWFAQIVGFPQESKGFMTSGGSLANQSAFCVARTVMCEETFAEATIYISDQAHQCLSKAARFTGFNANRLRVVRTDSHFRMSTSDLDVMIQKDRANGLKPMMIVATAGTTNTGAVDPLDELATLSADQNMWFHIDAAYGGFFCLTERGGAALKGLDRAHSVALDPHKTLFLPYGTGALLVRNGRWLQETFQEHADYLPDSSADEGIMDFKDISPELTRPFRGLRVWLPLKVHGSDEFAARLDEKLDLAQLVCQHLKADPALEVLAEPELSILAFACRPNPAETIGEINNRTKRLLALINKKNRVHLTGTMLNERFAIRVAIGVYRTHQSHIELLFADLRTAIEELEKAV